MLFEPNHLMVYWIKFLQAFVHFNYDDAFNNLQYFVQNLRDPQFPLFFKIGDTGLLFMQYPNEYQRNSLPFLRLD